MHFGMPQKPFVPSASGKGSEFFGRRESLFHQSLRNGDFCLTSRIWENGVFFGPDRD